MHQVYGRDHAYRSCLVIRTESVIQVETTCPGFVALSSGKGAVAYQAPAYEAAINDSNRIYAGISNFSSTLVTGDRCVIVSSLDCQ